jgi:integrase
MTEHSNDRPHRASRRGPSNAWPSTIARLADIPEEEIWLAKQKSKRTRRAYIRAYLTAAGHAQDLDGPMFRPLSHDRKGQEGWRYIYPDAIDRVLRKHEKAMGLTRLFSVHSMRATFITTALENGAMIDDVQRAAGHSEPGTTKLYDRRAYNPEKSASFFATY